MPGIRPITRGGIEPIQRLVRIIQQPCDDRSYGAVLAGFIAIVIVCRVLDVVDQSRNRPDVTLRLSVRRDVPDVIGQT